MMYRVLWVACIIERDGKLLLARRLKSMDRGLWGPPGGSVEQGESLIAAAERECMEETACILHEPRVIGFSDVDPRGVVAFVRGRIFEADPQQTEPTKQEPWQWVLPHKSNGVQQGIMDYWAGSYLKATVD